MQLAPPILLCEWLGVVYKFPFCNMSGFISDLSPSQENALRDVSVALIIKFVLSEGISLIFIIIILL